MIRSHTRRPRRPRRTIRRRIGPALAVIVWAGSACASSGGPPLTVNELGIAGVWSFDIVLEESIRGTVTFTGDDRYSVRCIEDTTRPPPPRLLTMRAGALEFRGCGATFQVRQGGDGEVVADVWHVVQEPYSQQGPCIATRTFNDGSVRCVQWERVIAYRDRTVRGRAVLEPIVSMR